MGLGLILLPVDLVDDSSFVLAMFRGDGCIYAIRDIKERGKIKISTYVCTSGDTSPHWGVAEETPYGSKITYIYAEDIKKSSAKQLAKHWINKASLNFIHQCPDDLKVALYWC